MTNNKRSGSAAASAIVLCLGVVAAIWTAALISHAQQSKKEENKKIADAGKSEGVLISKGRKHSSCLDGNNYDRCFLLDTDGNTNTPEVAVIQTADCADDVMVDTLFDQATVGQRDSIENWANRLPGRHKAQVVLLNGKTR